MLATIKKILNTNIKTVLTSMRFVTIAIAMLQIFASLMSMINLLSLDIESILIASYCFGFALIIIVFECRFKSLEPKVRRNFGFFYSYRGRAFFLIFVGLLNIGIDSTWGILAGVLMCIDAVVMLLVIYCHNDFRSGGSLSPRADPTQGVASAEEKASQFVQNNPKVGLSVGKLMLDASVKSQGQGSSIRGAESTLEK